MENKEILAITDEAVEKKMIRGKRMEVVQVMLDRVKQPNIPPQLEMLLYDCLRDLTIIVTRRPPRKQKKKKPSFKTLVNRGQRPKPAIPEENDAKVTSFLDSLKTTPNE